MTALKTPEARTDVLNRLRRAEGQIRGIQRMIEEGENCMKIGQQFSAVRKALEDEIQAMMNGKKKADVALKDAQKKADELMRPYVEQTALKLPQ